MMLEKILEGCDYVQQMQDADIAARDIAGIAYDSRKVRDNYLFMAIKGEKVDGHMFIRDAVKRGATVIASENESDGAGSGFILVRDSRKALACMANNFYGRPSEDLILTGVTGTNGKSTAATLIYKIFDKAYQDSERKIFFGGNIGGSLLNSLDKITEKDLVIMELSSFQLRDLEKLSKSPHVAIILNITPDHLDYHKDFGDYLNAKKNILKFQKKNQSTLLQSPFPPTQKKFLIRSWM